MYSSGELRMRSREGRISVYFPTREINTKIALEYYVVAYFIICTIDNIYNQFFKN